MARDPRYSTELDFAPTFRWGGREWGVDDQAAFARKLGPKRYKRWLRNHQAAARVFDPVEQEVYGLYKPQLDAIGRQREMQRAYYDRLSRNLSGFTAALGQLLSGASALSETELITAFFFGGIFRFVINNTGHPNNDRLIFSKGHASPLFYSLWTVAGKLEEEELMKMRKFGSLLEGQPTVAFAYVEAATGSLGQGLSIGLGMALNAKYLDQTALQNLCLTR